MTYIHSLLECQVLSIQKIDIPEFEEVLEAKDITRGLHCFIAIHNTTLGPALGGVRIYPYFSRDEALHDVLRLARAMTYKSAILENGLGGGKSVIIADPRKSKSHECLHAFAEVLDTLQGRYIAAEDVGSGIDDMAIIREKTPYVAALPLETSSGDPSRFTAHGIFRGIQAVAQHLWKTLSLKGKTIAIQGLGHVGAKLAEILFWEGAHLLVCDVDVNKSSNILHRCGATVISPDHFCLTECDILAPCALGGVLTSEIVPLLRCKAIAGGANNQLSGELIGQMLFDRDILYAPDFVINSGGIINASAEFEEGGYNPKYSRDKVDLIFDTLLRIFQQSKLEQMPTDVIVNKIAEHNVAHRIGKRTKPIIFKK